MTRLLYQSYEKFLNSQDELLQKMAQCIPVLEDARLNSPQKNLRIAQILREAEAIERSQLMQVQAQQRAFASEHNIILQPF